MITIVLIAFGLAMDSFTVAISGGASATKVRIKDALLIALYFGFFQGFMTFLGWYGGSAFNVWIEAFDHWVAFGLLTLIGLKMIWEAVKNEQTKIIRLTHKLLLLLAIATSIDAFGTGLSFAFLGEEIVLPSLIIGGITFVFSLIGFYLGKLLSRILKSKAEFLGGIILIGIGVKILLEHL